jgi:hypothetical protein
MGRISLLGLLIAVTACGNTAAQPPPASPVAPATAVGFTVELAGDLPFIQFSGDIDEQTPVNLEKVLRSVQPALDRFVAVGEEMAPSQKGQLREITGAYLILNSNGGDVESAMRAGEIARRYNVTMKVMTEASCASACVLLLVGGVDRYIFGNVGVHRPYSASYSSSLSESNRRYKNISALVERYLSTMNMPPGLINAMNATPPDQVHWLTPDEMDAFGISGSDPVWQDRVDSVQAHGRGISKEEYYARMQRARETCKSIPVSDSAWNKCYYGIVGLPR